ncbi:MULTISPECIES: NAD(P)/FAD-dependent oxidoreductase [Rhizobium/Agrobacterium group]|uniref:FAD dependent oxidoreductase n=1 Tax=Agrobacterium tomkonis CFBP 6623 TaxID=1183432 RepID=A0A1S7P733_9HYPH|nr:MULTISPECIES: NAD(P)/FAD-dependent oxidoreductase [Rhizobium/Agrobacterium group]KRA60542.1 FAD/NAD(P)-binding oxidoreductase [Rhizobium sp. Root651]QCL89805.1 NAD(P)/FAD-dependent oxidoreductase [Agrobacterium tumefaciens]CUX16987.1 FAD dependent oxidoreductase [Agrobacterium tomkonis CFBP 6623]
MVQSLSTEFDVAVIGAGVVGCAVARRFALAGAKVVVIEKGADILSGASKANSAILHTGFDAPEGSLELELVKAGRAEYLSIHGRMGLSLVKTGALVCAWNPDEAERLEAIAEQGRRNGIAELGLLTARQARETMPGLSGHLTAALEVSGEHIIDPWSAPLGYLTQAVGLGAQLVRNAEVLSGSFDGAWRIETTAGPILAASIVNAAGLFGDIVDARLGLAPEFTIMPRKGQFVVLDKAARRHVPRIVLPVPTEITKGIVVCPTAFGNVLVGPTAEEQDDRERATVETATLETLLKRGAEIVPALASISVTAVYAGLRPASEKKHYRISVRPDRLAITLGGVRSTGLSAALGLAQHALTLHAGFGTRFDLPLSVPDVTMPNLTETCERDWQRADHGEIICHCELVTRREIDATFSSPVPPGDFGGLRRRTRAGMGRCQGFYCNARLAAMTGDRLAVPLAVGAGDER